MKLLVFDSETTGVQTNADPSKPHARVVQIAAKLIDVATIPEYNEIVPTIHTFKAVVNSEVDIPEGASNIHGITNEHMETYGINHLSMLDVFADMLKQSDAIMGHNVSYDKRIMSHAYHLEGFTFDGTPFGDRPTFDTMLMATPLCKIPKPQGNGYRWPKLTIAWKHFMHIEEELIFKEERPGESYNDLRRAQIEENLEYTVSQAHDAMIDVDMSMDIFFSICRQTGNNYGIGA